MRHTVVILVTKPLQQIESFQDELQTLRKALGTRIRELRSARQWTQEEFAANAHFHRAYAGALERGEKNVSFHGLVIVARCFGISVSELLKGIENGEPLRRKGTSRTAPNLTRILSEIEILERTTQALRKHVSEQQR
jgi:transcriptional regulator with XRE-family HTH domain